MNTRIKTIMLLSIPFILGVATMFLILLVNYAPPPYTALTVEEVYQHYLANDAVFVDTRLEQSYLENHIPGALWITVDNVTDSLYLLPSDKTTMIISYCDCLSRGGTAVQVLKELEKEGYTNLAFMNAPFSTEWSGNPGYPVESGSATPVLEIICHKRITL
ncbi:MAG: rhodanese-like domain-containing protein [Candidatus Odinarchaeota archaeon]